MATLLSPGVDTVEVDQSFVETGAPAPGLVLIGRTGKGPAFYPTTVQNFDQFAAVFGPLDPDLQLPYAARNYLENATALTVVRVLGHDDGTSASSGYTVGGVIGISDTSGSNSVTGSILAVIHHSGAFSGVSVAGVSGDSNKFTFVVGTKFAATASFVTSSDDYIGKVLNTDPTLYETYGHYLHEVYRYQKQAASSSWHAVQTLSASHRDFLRDFEGGKTTWIKSQVLGGLEYDVMRFHTLGHGRATNDDVKVTIANIKPAVAPNVYPYGTFDVIVRRFDDTDLRPVVLERFTQLSLDEDSPNFILRRIGDTVESFDTTQRKFIVTGGTYPNRSRYIRAELAATNYPAESLPWGFRGYPKMRFSGSATAGVGANKVPDLPYVASMNDGNGTFNENISWGIQFVSGGIVDRMRAFPDIPTVDLALSGTDSDFSMKSLSGTYENGTLRYWYNSSYTAYAPVFASGSWQKFTVPLYGGFDGWDLRVADPLYLGNSVGDTNIGVVSAKRAVDCVANPDLFDMNLIAAPGIHNLKVTDKIRTMVNSRKDVLYVMDITGSSVDEAIDSLKNREIDDNYTAAYYPDLRIRDAVNNRNVRVAPSVGVVGAIAYNDRTAQPFFAPAGMDRGVLKKFGVVDLIDRLGIDDRDKLYQNRINPITTFPQVGVTIFGNKTLQIRSSALDRINVRRLLILAKKTVAEVARNLVFEPNNTNTWQRFVSKVNPILERIRQDQGINRFKVVMDSTTNKPDMIDKNEMRGKIFLEPTRAAEYVSVDFVITPTGVTFQS